MSISLPPHCKEAKDALAKAKRETAFRRKELADAERKLNELEAAQPPDEAAIKDQKAEVDQAQADWLAAKEKQKDCEDTVDQFCNP